MSKTYLEDLLLEVKKIANKEYDGHFTILKFTTNYKSMFGTIDLDCLTGRASLREIPGFPTLQGSLEFLIRNKHGRKFRVKHIVDGVMIKTKCEELGLIEEV